VIFKIKLIRQNPTTDEKLRIDKNKAKCFAKKTERQN